MARLYREFYLQDTLTAARALLGKCLVRRLDGELLAVRITETEAYIGRCDRACHAFGYRRTARTETLFRQAGTAYIYFIYGMYHCLNFVTEAEGIAAAFTYLCQYNGVDALTVRGTIVTSSNPDDNETGCWNVVRNDDEAGTWYGVSITAYDGDDRSPLMAGASTEVGVSGPGFSSVYVADLDLASENSLNPIQISATGFDWPDDRTFFEKYGTHVFAVILVAIIAGVIVYALRTGNV